MDQKKDEKLFTEFPAVTTAEWEAKIREDLKGADYEKKLVYETYEGIKLKPYYRADDLSSLSYLKSNPGEYPYLRGNHSNCNDWEIRQDVDEADVDKANAIAVDALKRGATSIGFNVEKVVAAKDLKALINNIDLENTFLHFYSSPNYVEFARLLVQVLKSSGVEVSKVKGSLDFDPISYLLLYGDFYESQEVDMAQAAELLALVSAELPGFKAITINGDFFHNAASNSVQEIAFSLNSAVEYISFLTDAGFFVDVISKHMTLCLGIGSNYFMEIAKIRAARYLWARIIEQYKPVSEEARKVYIHCNTSIWNKTIYDPYVNLLRSTTEVMSAAIAGADSITAMPFDIAYKDSDEFSQRIARNQQVILKEEAYLDKTVDPAAGSYYLESLTDALIADAWKQFLACQEKGGMIEAIKTGYIQHEIGRIAIIKGKDIATRKASILGTNQYPNSLEKMLDKVEEEEDYEDEVSEVEDEDEPTYEPLFLFRGAEDYEDLRLATEAYVTDGNKCPKVFLLTIGNLAMRKARAGFSNGFFGVAGFQVLDNPGFATVEEGVKAALSSHANVVVICSSDEEYADYAPAIAKKIKNVNDQMIVLVAGYPKEIVDSLKASGVDDFIHVRMNVLEFLNDLQLLLGVVEEDDEYEEE
ncbi:MAG: methylmalonyl-CoA mutase family protein [Bacteroidota bacterium]|nr:methylmalonyl-CoA mutase family protein [Bacteroidota bacterium]